MVTRMKVELSETEIKKAITYYIARKFQLDPESVESVDIYYGSTATVLLRTGDGDE